MDFIPTHFVTRTLQNNFVFHTKVFVHKYLQNNFVLITKYFVIVTNYFLQCRRVLQLQQFHPQVCVHQVTENKTNKSQMSLILASLYLTTSNTTASGCRNYSNTGCYLCSSARNLLIQWRPALHDIRRTSL